MFEKNPYKYNYQICRTILAVAQIIILAFTSKEAFLDIKTVIFLDVQNPFIAYGYITYIFAYFTLLLVISGFIPQVSSIFHFILSFILMHCSSVVEGGDQIALIITAFLVPICIFDKRINIWKILDNNLINPYLQLISNSTFRVIQIQIAIVYLFAAAVKLTRNEWVNGTAIYYWYYNESFGANIFFDKLLSPLVDSHLLSPLINWGVLVLEFTLFLSLFMPRRINNYLFYIAIFFHFMIGIVFGLWIFSLIMTSALILLLLPKFMNYEK